MVLAQRKCGPLTRLIRVLYFHFGICFHRKVSAKAWNGISFFKRNILMNEISFSNIPAAVPVLLDMVEQLDKTCSIYFLTGFSANLSTWKTTTACHLACSVAFERGLGLHLEFGIRHCPGLHHI